jgi:hypothetical protein
MQSSTPQAIREQTAKPVDDYAAIALAQQPFVPGITSIPLPA